MRWLFLLPIAYLAAVVETSLADVFCIGHVGPDLLALAAVAWVLMSEQPRAFVAAGVCGLLSDLVSPGQPGLGMALFLLTGYGVGRFRAKFSPDHLVWQVGTVWFAVTLLAVVLGVGYRVAGETSTAIATLVARGLGVGVYTAGIAVPVLMVTRWLCEPFTLSRKHASGFIR
jgi:rod shape-determining protein MreD